MSKSVSARLPEEIVEKIDELSDTRAEFIREAVRGKLSESGNPESQTEEPVPDFDVENPTPEEVLDLMGLDFKIEGPLGLPIPRGKLKLVKREKGDEE